MTTNDAVWVESDLAADGTYAVGLHCGDDVAWTFNRDDAIRHAAAVMAQVEHADHDAAVIKLFHNRLGLDLATAVACVVRDLRPDRPPVDEPGPLKLIPSVSATDLHPFLRTELNGHVVGQWELDDARHHAMSVLQVVAAVDSDAAFYRLLVGSLGLSQTKARRIVADTANHRNERESQ